MPQTAQLSSFPSPVVSLHNGKPTTTSLNVAEVFNKRHDHIIRDIRILSDNVPETFRAPNFGESSYINEQGKEQPMFTLTRDGLTLLVMGYTGKKAMQFKLAYIEAFNAMEAKIFQPAPAQPLPDATLTPDQQCTLQAIVKGKVEALPEDQRKGKGLYPQLWSRFNNHFRIAKYSQLPQCRMSDAIAYLMQMEINQPKALPTADTVPALPAERRGRHVPGPVERELLALEEEIRHGFFGMAAQFRETMDRMRSAARPLYSPTYEKLGWHSRIGFSVDGLADGLGGGYWDSLRHMEEAVDDARAYARQFVTLARLHGM